MGFSAGVGFLVDTDGNGTNDGKVVTLKKGSNITLSLSGSTLTIASSGGGEGGSAITIQDEGSSLSTAAETIDFVGAGVTATGTGTTKTITIPGTDTNTFRTVKVDTTNDGTANETIGSSEDLELVGGTNVTLAETGGKVTITSTDTNTQLSQAQVEDFAGGLFTGNTETFISATYEASDNTVDLVVPVKDEDNMGSNSATHLATQQSIKAYVDSVASGLDVKDSVRVATTASITIATALNNGDTLDGVTLANGNRVLVKDQSTASENGIYVVGASPARATDLAAGDTAAGFFTFVEEGTVNADIGYVCTSNAGGDTVGTHNLAFAQFSAAGQVTAGTLLDKSGSTLNVDLSEAAAAVMAEADEFVFLDNDDSSASKRESLSDLLDTIAGAVATTGLDRSGATLVVSDLHPVGVSGSANQLLTDNGDGTITSESTITFDSPTLTLQANGSGIKVTDTTASSSTGGGMIRLASNDGALMATGHRLGVIEFAGAEDGSNTITTGARIEVLANGAWSGTANAADMIFYTTTGNATQGEVMRLTHEKAISTQGGITVQTGASSSQKALYLRHQDVDVIALDIAADNTTANVVSITANDLTTADALKISAPSMTTGKLIDAVGVSVIADGGDTQASRIYSTTGGIASQTHVGSLSYVKKTATSLSNTGITGSGKTSTITAHEAWANDTVTNHASGTSIVRGIHGKATFGNATGTTSTFGGVFEVSGATNNYGVQIIGGSLLLGTLSAAPADISTYGQLWVKDNGSGADNTELYFTNDNGDDIQITDGNSLAASSLAFTTISVAGQSDVVADGATDTLTFAAGSNIAIATDAGGDQITISATGSISGGITVQEEGSSLSTLGDTLNFVGTAVTASGTGTTKTITISGGGAFARSTNKIATTETIGIGGSNAEEFSLTSSDSLNSEAIMTNGGTNASVVTKGMGMKKNVTIVVPDADTADDTYTVADSDHNIMICNVRPSDSLVNGSQIIRHVQLPPIGTTYVGREITIVLHAVSSMLVDNITVKPASDDVILYHGRMWDNNMTAGGHTGIGTSLGGDGMTMGHAAGIDVNWASLGQVSVIAVTMVAVDHGRLSALLGGGDPRIPITNDPGAWQTGDQSVTSDVWLLTSVSGQNVLTDRTGLARDQAGAGIGLEGLFPRGS